MALLDLAVLLHDIWILEKYYLWLSLLHRCLPRQTFIASIASVIVHKDSILVILVPLGLLFRDALTPGTQEAFTSLLRVKVLLVHGEGAQRLLACGATSDQESVFGVFDGFLGGIRAVQDPVDVRSVELL